MSDIIVDAARCVLSHGAREIPCIIGKSGSTAGSVKREGDGATPLGVWPFRVALLRPDRVPTLPSLALPWRWLRLDDGWSDDPADAAYNRPVRHPRDFSAERLWRGDEAYDAIIVLGYNDAPPAPGRGSAIFLHCIATHDYTEGCVAIAKSALLDLLPSLTPADNLIIR